MRISIIIMLMIMQLVTLFILIKKNDVIANQEKTINELTVKYIGTSYEQQLLREANEMRKVIK